LYVQLRPVAARHRYEDPEIRTVGEFYGKLIAAGVLP